MSKIFIYRWLCIGNFIDIWSRQWSALFVLPGSDYLDLFTYQVPTTWTRSFTGLRLHGLVPLPGSNYLDSFTYQAPTTSSCSFTRFQLPGLVHLPGSDYLDFFTYQAPTTWTHSLTSSDYFEPTPCFCSSCYLSQFFHIVIENLYFSKTLTSVPFPWDTCLCVHVCQCLLMFVFVRYTEEFVSP